MLDLVNTEQRFVVEEDTLAHLGQNVAERRWQALAELLFHAFDLAAKGRALEVERIGVVFGVLKEGIGHDSAA